MQIRSYINGKWVTPDSGRTVRNMNPANISECVAEFASAGEREALDAIEAASKAFAQWRDVPAPERGRYVARCAEKARGRAEEIARVMTREEGKLIKEALGEVKKGISLLEYYGGAGFRLNGQTIPSELANCFAYTIRRPIGVVGIIGPWNFPWAIPCWKVAPALVAGNTVVFKPAELTPGTATLLVELFQEAGLPPGVLNMVIGPGSAVGEAIIHHPHIRAVSFTGSNEVGKRVIEEAAKTNKKVQCEMGGKNALILMEDGDVDAAVAATADGAFGSTGQRCTATSRVLVHEKVKDEFMTKLLAKAREYVPGNGMDAAATMGPVVDKKQFESVLSYIESGKREGARLVLGGKKAAGNGYFIEPTIFNNVTPEMKIFQEEIFGPVLAITPFGDFSKAISFSNCVKYGFTGAIFTRDIKNIMHFIEHAEIRMVHINEPTIGGEAQLPFGGCKATGYGDREMADDGLNFFTQTKTVFINYSGRGERAMIR
ncbi:MAG: aldehyde dehydrogenase family protein [Candidatus Aureabacteria bacterium]|nr:aldehyde dehydrogenase family protein [Candidatus Auribacterota bacterium]